MSTFTRMAFSPETGLKDKDVYVTTPVTEDEAREQIQGIADQLKEHINNYVLEELENAETDSSGAGKIGSQAISNLSGTTVFDQINDLKSQIDSAVVAGITTGSVTTDAIADDAVTQDKIAANSVGTDEIIDGAVTSDKILDEAVSEDKLAAGAVTADIIGAGAITEAKIDTGAVTETKIGTGAVTETKIAASAKTDSILTVSSSILATATAVRTAVLTACDFAAGKEDALEDNQKRKITLGTADPSGGSSGDIYIKYS